MKTNPKVNHNEIVKLKYLIDDKGTLHNKQGEALCHNDITETILDSENNEYPAGLTSEGKIYFSFGGICDGCHDDTLILCLDSETVLPFWKRSVDYSRITKSLPKFKTISATFLEIYHTLCLN
jgi:hypothetical protein